MTESEPATGADPGVIHNVGLTAIRVGDQSIPSGGSLDVDDVAALGELPADAYVVRKPSSSAEAPQEAAQAPEVADTAEKAPKRPRSHHAATGEPTTPAQPAEPAGDAGAEEPTP